MSLATELAEAGIPFRFEVIERERLRPNPWNPNRMDERTFAAERESIQTFGFLDPLTVRPHPTLEGEFEIVDGEHRLRATDDLDYPKLPCLVLDLDEAAARKLTVILNETRGEADPVLQAELLNDLRSHLGDEGVQVGLPYTSAEIAALRRIADDDWSEDPDSRPASDSAFWPLRLALPPAFRETWEEAAAYVGQRNDLDGDERVAAGQVIIACVRSFLKHDA